MMPADIGSPGRVKPFRFPAVMLTVLALFASVLLSPQLAQGQHSQFEAAIARFEAKLATDVAEDGIGSIAAAVVVGNELIWQNAFGWADVANRIPATPDMIYRTGSISKSFTAVVLVQLVEQGVVALDDPVERFFPEIAGLVERPEGTEPITFRQLASHTAGLIREPRLQGAASGPIGGWEDKILASIPTTAYRSAPGTEYAYSNIGFGILGLALSRSASRPFMDLVTDQIFKPLGMESSTFVIGPDLMPLLTAGYANRRDGTVDAEFPAREHAGRGYKVPNGGIYSTAGDLARFIAGMTGAAPAPVLSAASRSEMLRKQTPEEGPSGYGLGFSIRVTEEGHHLVGHGGSVAGYTAHLLFDARTEIGVVLLRNYGRGATNLGGAARELLIELIGAPRPAG
jgi:CubicO group peptidase (beta-lactamase class C family)